jgi:hypothetical protein
VIVRKSLWAVGIALTLGGASSSIAACSSSSGGAGPADASTPIPVANCTDGGLVVAFSPMYSAFDGKHTFQVPAVVRGSNAQVTWSADSTMVGMQTDVERTNEVLITMLKAGAVIINVQSADGKCGSSLLAISAAQESDWEIGNARYNNGTSLHLGAAATGGKGSPLEQGNGGPACTNCHGETATNSAFTDVSHTPEQTGGFSDTDLLNIILRGTFPDGGFFDTNIVPYATWQGFHRWTDITMDQQAGIITYLRSLTPAPQMGQPNFGAFDIDSGSGDDMDATLGDATPVDTGAPDVNSDGETIDTGVDSAIVDAAVDVAVIDTGVADAGVDGAIGDGGDGGTTD